MIRTLDSKSSRMTSYRTNYSDTKDEFREKKVSKNLVMWLPILLRIFRVLLWSDFLALQFINFNKELIEIFIVYHSSIMYHLHVLK